MPAAMRRLRSRLMTSVPAWFRRKPPRYYLCSSRAQPPICCPGAAFGWQKARERAIRCCALQIAKLGGETVCRKRPQALIQHGRTWAAPPPVSTTPAGPEFARRPGRARTPPGRVSSWLKRSRLRMMVSPSASPSSLNSSTYLTDRQWAICRVSPSPKKPLSMPLQANRPTWPLCNGVTGRPVIFCCLRTRMPRAFCIATERCSASSTRLEDDLQAVLHFAGVARHRCLTQVCGRSVARDDVVGGAADLVQPTGIGRSAIYRSRDRSTVGSVDGATVEVGVVEQIEEVHAELDAEPLAPHLPVLVYREVGVDKPRSVAVAHRLQVIRNRSDLVTDQGHRIGVQHLSSGRALLTGIATR